MITIDRSGTKSAAIRGYNEAHSTAIIIRQVKYLNNIAEQDHRSMKQVTRLLSEFKSFETSQGTLVGIELRHTLKKGPIGAIGGQKDSLSPNSYTPWQSHP
jgi:putative transposase